MEDQKKYNSVPLPQRGENTVEQNTEKDNSGSFPINPSISKPVSNERKDFPNAINKPESLDRENRSTKTTIPDSVFAEVDIKINSKNNNSSEIPLRPFSNKLSEPLPPQSFSPIRTKFYEMRGLATARPFPRNDPELFYRQAKLMESFEDNYANNEAFHMYYPFYQHMGYEQLRTYFTWRTKFRKGEVYPISVSYMFVYVYELIHNIGVADPSEGLDMLLLVWEKCLDFAPVLESYLPDWFKDYHIYYNLPHDFTAFLKEHDMFKYFTLAYLFDAQVENKLTLWNSISGYDITKSMFYNQGNEKLMSDCFDAVLQGIAQLCSDNKLSCEGFFIYSKSRRTIWQPFKQALFHNWLTQVDCVVDIPGHGVYNCKNNRWSTNVPIYYASQRDFVGYIIKKTESCLRQHTNHKSKITAVQKPRFYESFHEMKELDRKGAGLAYAIEKAVATFYRDLNRTVITVSQESLERIRLEALGTQEKLIVPESEKIMPTNVKPELVQTAEVFSEADASSAVHETTLFAESAQNYQCLAVAENLNADAKNDQESSNVDVWVSLKKALTALELEALAIVSCAKEDIKAFANMNNIMLEVLADSINEKAFDLIGDSILEVDGSLLIYEDYKENIVSMLK